MRQIKCLAMLILIVAVIDKVSFAAPEEKRAKKPTKEVSESIVKKGALPKMIDLGAGKCKQCIEMAPILEELKKTYEGKVDVEFIDLWKHQAMGYKYEVNVMPTQIFFDTSGKEVFRHEGVMSKDEIITKWKQLGFKL